MQAGGKQIIVRQATTPQLATAATASVGQPAVQLQAAQQPTQQQVVVAATPQQAAAVALQQQQQQQQATAAKQPVMQTIQLQGGQRLSLIQTPGRISCQPILSVVHTEPLRSGIADKQCVHTD